MILPDTSIWVDHLRFSDRKMQEHLDRDNVFCHPFVTGELALGTLINREKIFASLRRLPTPIIPTDEEVMSMIERHRISGRGIGLVDAHLLASVLLTPEARLWTRDKRLRAVATELGVDADLAVRTH